VTDETDYLRLADYPSEIRPSGASDLGTHSYGTLSLLGPLQHALYFIDPLREDPRGAARCLALEVGAEVVAEGATSC
jgi:hypothetical protein